MKLHDSSQKPDPANLNKRILLTFCLSLDPLRCFQLYFKSLCLDTFFVVNIILSKVFCLALNLQVGR